MGNRPRFDRRPSRREFLAGAVGTAGLLLARSATGADVDHTTVEIAQGRLRGVRKGDVHVFKGVPCGASPAGSARFQAPRPAAPWSGIREAIEYGPSSLQSSVPISHAKGLPANIPPMTRLLGWGTDESQSEDCLVLNIWTPGVRDGRKRPVPRGCPYRSPRS
jgi:para-nitrobenzyl esterase